MASEMEPTSHQTLVFVTGNAHKLDEVLNILGQDFPFKVENRALDLPEIQGSSLEVARAKCRTAADLIGGAVLIEDTSLEFRAFGGLPGPYVRWFLENIGPEGLYRMLESWQDKGAFAVCTVAFCEGPSSEVHLFQGRTEGVIVPPSGDHGFGWDVCFKPLGYDETYAQMDPQQKNDISHRGKAVNTFKYFILEQ